LSKKETERKIDITIVTYFSLYYLLMGSERLRWEVTWGNDRILEVQTIKKEEKSRKMYIYEKCQKSWKSS
jgi:hypothetical protein